MNELVEFLPKDDALQGGRELHFGDCPIEFVTKRQLLQGDRPLDFVDELLKRGPERQLLQRVWQLYSDEGLVEGVFSKRQNFDICSAPKSLWT